MFLLCLKLTRRSLSPGKCNKKIYQSKKYNYDLKPQYCLHFLAFVVLCASSLNSLKYTIKLKLSLYQFHPFNVLLIFRSYFKLICNTMVTHYKKQFYAFRNKTINTHTDVTATTVYWHESPVVNCY